jgi:hypothetical protein
VGLAHIAHDVGSSTSRVPNADLFGAPRAALAATRLPGRGIRLLRAASYCSVAQPENENKGSLSGTRRMTWYVEQTARRVEYVAGRWSLPPLRAGQRNVAACRLVSEPQGRADSTGQRNTLT